MERLKENLEKWSFIEKYRHLDDLCSTLDSIEEGCESLKHGKIIGASVFFYEASEKLKFLNYCEKHGKDYIDSMYESKPRHYLDDYYEDCDDEVDCDYEYLVNKYLLDIDSKDLSEFSEKFHSCLEHLKSIDFSEFDVYLDPNSKYAEALPNGCKEGDEFISLLNVFGDFIKESGYPSLDGEFFIEPLLDDYKDRNYVYVGQVIKNRADSLIEGKFLKEPFLNDYKYRKHVHVGQGTKDKIDTFSFSSSLIDEIDLLIDDYDRMLCEKRKCFYRFYNVACNLKLKKIS